jgi:hypothetical protein
MAGDRVFRYHIEGARSGLLPDGRRSAVALRVRILPADTETAPARVLPAHRRGDHALPGRRPRGQFWMTQGSLESASSRGLKAEEGTTPSRENSRQNGCNLTRRVAHELTPQENAHRSLDPRGVLKRRMEVAVKFFELVRMPFRYVFGVFVANVFFLFAPDRYLVVLGVLKYRQTERPYFGLLFFVLLATTIAAIFDAGVRTAQYYSDSRAARKRLHSLSPDEKRILRKYVAQGGGTFYLNIQDGTVNSLAAEGLIYRSSIINNPMHGLTAFAHNMQPWVLEYLRKSPELVDLKRERSGWDQPGETR